jgi:hypothetical protein
MGWLLDSDPSIRWQAMHDLTDASAEESEVVRARVATEGAGARLLAGVAPDERAAEAIDLVESKRGTDGRWLLETRYPGVMPVELDEGMGRPSRSNTLRALRVLAWFTPMNARFQGLRDG